MRVIFGIASLCLLAAGLILAPIAYQDLSPKAGATELKDPSACDTNGTAKMAVVKMDEDDSLIANVRINDQFDEKFLVDTGADNVIINQDTALRLGFHLNEQDYTETSETADSIVRVAPVVVESLEDRNYPPHECPRVRTTNQRRKSIGHVGVEKAQIQLPERMLPHGTVAQSRAVGNACGWRPASPPPAAASFEPGGGGSVRGIGGLSASFARAR